MRSVRWLWSGLPSGIGLLSATLAWSDEGHGHGVEAAPTLLTNPWVVGGVLVVFILLGLLALPLIRSSEYWQRIHGFQRNARLLLLRAPFLGASLIMWNVLYNLYLLGLGYDTTFVADMIFYNWIGHGLFVIPAGMMSDMWGRRRVFLVAYGVTIALRLARIVVLDPTALLMLSGFGGASEGFHAVIGAPFMTEQSRPQERTHLFAVDSTLRMSSAFFGAIIGGFIPLAIAGFTGVPKEGAWALRGALFVSVPIQMMAWVPVYWIREEWQRTSLRRWWEGVESYRHIGMFALTSGLMSIALGLTAPMFNVFFVAHAGAGVEQYGLITGIGTAMVAVSALTAPFFVRRFGKVRTIVFVRMLGIPFLLLMPLAPTLGLAAAFFVMNLVLLGELFPNGGLADPVTHLFPMEVVTQHERGTTNGVMHAFQELPMAIGAVIAKPFVAGGDWHSPYIIAGIFYAVAFVVYLGYFARVEVAQRRLAAAVAAGQPAGG